VNGQPAALSLPGAAQRHLDRSRPTLSDLPELSGTLVAEESIVAAGQHGGHPPSVSTQRWIPDRENPAMKEIQLAPPHAMRDRISSQAEVNEL
jgi:hypothetical protein